MKQSDVDRLDRNLIPRYSLVSSIQGHKVHRTRASWYIYDYKTGADTRLVVRFLCGSASTDPVIENPRGDLCLGCEKKYLKQSNEPSQLPLDLHF